MITIRPTPHTGQTVAHRAPVTTAAGPSGAAGDGASGGMAAVGAAAPSSSRQAASFSRRSRLASNP